MTKILTQDEINELLRLAGLEDNQTDLMECLDNIDFGVVDAAPPFQTESEESN